MSARYRIRLLEDDEANKPTPKTMIFDSFGMNNDSKQQPEPLPFKHLYIKDINLLPVCKISKSTIHKQGIISLKSYKCGDIIYTDVPLFKCPGFTLLWKTDPSNQIIRLWEIYSKTNKTKKGYFEEILHFNSDCMAYIDIARAVNKLSMEPTFKIRYLSQNQIPDNVKSKLNQHLQQGYHINTDKETAFNFEKWCKVITIFKLNAINDCVYYVSSTLNHSCSPNVCINSDGKIIALCDIKVGEELLISYLSRDASLYKYQELRTIEIQKTKGFQCKCIRCVPKDLYDDARNFKCQHCLDGMISWNANSSRFFTRCNNNECERFPNTNNQAKFMSIEKKLSVFLLENTGGIAVNALKMKGKEVLNDEKENAKDKLNDDLKVLLNDGQKYLKKHYLLIALYHRLCQLNLHIDWLRLRYETMCDIYNKPNDCLLRALMEYHRFLPLLAVGDMMTGKIKKNDQDKMIKVDKHQEEMDKLQGHIDLIKNGLGLND
eukprot:179831_1